MHTTTQPLRDERRELLPSIERIRRVADAVGLVPTEVLRSRIAEIEGSLIGELLPHARAEEACLYPAVARVMGSPEAIATMRHDHVEVAGLVEELAALAPELSEPSLSLDVERALRRILYGLYTLLKVHFIEDDEIYLPLLEERLTEEESAELLRRMQAVELNEKARASASGSR